MTLEVNPIQPSIFYKDKVLDPVLETFDENLILKIIANSNYYTILCRLNTTWYTIFNESILIQLRSLGFSNSLEDIFYFPQNATPSKIVLFIIQKIKESTHKSVIQLINDYTHFYAKNILNFWERLPGGKKFIESKKIRFLPKKLIIEQFEKWLKSLNFNNITSLDLSKADLNFLPLQINLFKNLKNLDLRYNNIEVIPELQLKLTKLFTFGNPLKIVFGQQISA